jgi:uroporphyrinogen-III synthase
MPSVRQRVGSTGWVVAFGAVAPPEVVAIGPQTAAAAERAGLKVSSIAADHSLAGLVEALEERFSTRG